MKQFDGPLTKKDVVYLRSRHADPYVDRQIALLGLADGSKTALDAPEEPSGPEGEGEGAEGPETPGEGAEDLIGDPDEASADFDVLGSTEQEVKTWVETASDEAKALALAVEQGREDRDPRKGVVSVLS